ncbi:MAG: hypothetical protein OXG35_20945, partial [Acidobacteria bacterium]|nr:hypothetical protein [Acidobacteriota bacterium]
MRRDNGGYVLAGLLAAALAVSAASLYGLPAGPPRGGGGGGGRRGAGRAAPPPPPPPPPRGVFPKAPPGVFQLCLGRIECE